MYITLSYISPSLKILNATFPYCINNKIHKSTLITYLIKSLLKKHSIRKTLNAQFV